MTGHLEGISQRDSQPQVRMTARWGVSENSDKTTWHSGWTPCFWKFSRKSSWAFPSRNWTWRGGIGGLEERNTNVRCHAQSSWERKRKHIINKTNRKKRKDMYAWNMHEHVMCIMGKNPIQTYQHTSTIIKHTSKCMKHCYNANEM